MKWLTLSLLALISLAHAEQDNFENEARALVADLKKSLVSNLTEKMTKEGPVAAVPFCHANVKQIAKGAAKDRIAKYEFGRTSHKVRNEENAPKPWAVQYLKEFEGKKKGEVSKTFIIHKLEDGKRVYMEPLYVEAKCLVCHGENVDKKVSDKINELYKNDKATGFKLDEFRGLIWVKEK